MQFLRIVLRSVFLLSWALVFLSIATILSFMFRKKSYILMNVFYYVASKILGLKIILPKKLKFPKQSICISNHISYLDIFVYGKVLNPVFIGKSEIRKWPIVGFMGAKIVGMFFLDRRRSQIIKEKTRLTNFIRKIARPLLFFPEGTTSDGSGTLRFKSALFEMILADKKNIVVPFRIKYTQIGKKKIQSKTDRRVVAWYNDQDPKLENPSLLTHLFNVFSQSNFTVEIVFGKEIKVKDFKDRVILTSISQKAIEDLF